MKSQKDFFMGLGIGLVFASLVWIASSFTPLSDAEVITKAKELGMVFPRDIGIPQTVVVTTEGANSIAPSNTSPSPVNGKQNQLDEEIEEAAEVKKPVEKIVNYTIRPGSSARTVANELEDMGVIADADLLVKELGRMQLAGKVKAKGYKFDITYGPLDIYQVIKDITR